MRFLRARLHGFIGEHGFRAAHAQPLGDKTSNTYTFQLFRITWWTFRIFFFSAPGRGRESPGRRGGGGGGFGFLLKIPGRGGGFWQEGWEGPGRREGVCREFGGIGGGLNFFFRGRKLAKIRNVIGDGPNTVSESTVSNTELIEFFGPHQLPGRELSELLSAYDCCGVANSPSLSQNSPSVAQNSVSSLFRDSTLETQPHPFPISGLSAPKTFFFKRGSAWSVTHRQFWTPVASPRP